MAPAPIPTLSLLPDALMRWKTSAPDSEQHTYCRHCTARYLAVPILGHYGCLVTSRRASAFPIT